MLLFTKTDGDKPCGIFAVKNGKTEAGKPAEEAPTNGWLEQVYSRFDGVPLRALDIFIGICVFAFIAVIAVGIMKARGIL